VNHNRKVKKLLKVYAFDPIPIELTDEDAKHILSAQANLWTEYVAAPEFVLINLKFGVENGKF
jgi:N-acetyl-beta-hexosaminidase